jgi:hypothetical protein
VGIRSGLQTRVARSYPLTVTRWIVCIAAAPVPCQTAPETKTPGESRRPSCSGCLASSGRETPARSDATCRASCFNEYLGGPKYGLAFSIRYCSCTERGS